MKTKSILLDKLVDLCTLSFIISTLRSNLFCTLSLHETFLCKIIFLLKPTVTHLSIDTFRHWKYLVKNTQGSRHLNLHISCFFSQQSVFVCMIYRCEIHIKKK